MSLHDDLTKHRAWHDYAPTAPRPAHIPPVEVLDVGPLMPRQSGFPKVSGPRYIGVRTLEESGVTASGDLPTRAVPEFLECEISKRVKIFDPMDAFLVEPKWQKVAKILAAEPLQHIPALVGSTEWRKPGTRFVPKSKGGAKVRFSVN